MVGLSVSRILSKVGYLSRPIVANRLERFL